MRPAPTRGHRVDEVEACRHHTDYGERLPVHAHVAAERRLRAPEELPAHSVAKNGLLVRAGLSLGIGKGAAVGWGYTQQPEQ
jgi:hypothetical protein